MNSSTIVNCVDAVTKKWTKQRKAEERGRARSRREAMTRCYRVTIKDAAFAVMEEAYMRASDDGRLPASARQIMYAARRQILEKTGRSSLDSQYFTQTLLPEYMTHWRYRNKTADWDVTYDARGHFEEPHTKVIVPVGTLDVRGYLADVREHAVKAVESNDFRHTSRFPTCGPDLRFGAIVFIEKEGFLPLFEVVKLAERYDIAIMSTKGMPVVACRHLADLLCGQHGIPLLVLHDFDKAGFSILGTLRDVDHWGNDLNDRTKRYEFYHDIEVIDLGLRLADVKAYKLESEEVRYRQCDPTENLEQNGATKEEIKFLCGAPGWNGRRGSRVELNAFTSADFIKWIESKLNEHGIKKVVPDDEVLTTAYRRAIQIALVHEQLDEIVKTATKQAEKMKAPKTLAPTVRKRLRETPTLSWDQVISELARSRKCKKRKNRETDSAS